MAGRDDVAPHVELDDAPDEVPLALARLHRRLGPGATATVRIGAPPPAPVSLDDVVEGAGFEIADRHRSTLTVVRLPTLPDTVGPGMAVLVCGLNPSHHAAQAGIGYAGPGNRFWPAMTTAGLLPTDEERPADPVEVLSRYRIGMTDMVKRPTTRAAELAPDEYRRGLTRLERLVAWLEPEVVCVVGLAGWRGAIDRRAVAGPLERELGGRPVYLMPSTSGLNTHTSLDDLADHLRRAVACADLATASAPRHPRRITGDEWVRSVR